MTLAKDMMGKDVLFTFKFTKTEHYLNSLGQPVDDMIREKAGKGSGKPHSDKVGKITSTIARNRWGERPIERDRHRRRNESYRRISTPNWALKSSTGLQNQQIAPNSRGYYWVK